jgi:hypothetical protein
MEYETMPQSARDMFARMSEDELADLILRLGYYALRESNRLRWRTGNSVELPGGETVDSIVSLALEKTLSGEREWNPETHPKLQEYLMDVIDSLLNHLATGRDNSLFTKVTSSDVDGVDNEGDKCSPNVSEYHVEWLTRGRASPETLLLEQEEVGIYGQAFELLRQECNSDPVLMKIIEVIVEGNEKAEQIATAAGLNVKEVYNAMKRLNRKARRVSLRISGLITVASQDK